MLTPGSLCKRQALQPISRLAGGSSQTQLLRLAQEILETGRSSPHKWARDQRHPAWRPEQDAPRWAQVHTPSTRDEPASASSAWERGTSKGGLRREPSSLQHACGPSHENKSFFPLPATPLQWGSPRAGGGSEPSHAWGTLHGKGDEGRAPLWETLAGAARGGASRRQPLDTQPHDAWRAKTLRL